MHGPPGKNVYSQNFYPFASGCADAEINIRLRDGRVSLGIVKPPPPDELTGRLQRNDLTFVFGKETCRISVTVRPER
jgi:hypothetical protein